MIKVQLAAQMGAWQTRNNLPLLIPDIVEKTGLSRNFMYRFARGEIERLDLDKLESLCRFFDCSPNDLIWTEDQA